MITKLESNCLSCGVAIRHGGIYCFKCGCVMEAKCPTCDFVVCYLNSKHIHRDCAKCGVQFDPKWERCVCQLDNVEKGYFYFELLNDWFGNVNVKVAGSGYEGKRKLKSESDVKKISKMINDSEMICERENSVVYRMKI